MNPCRTCGWYARYRCLLLNRMVDPDDREGCWRPDEIARRDGLAELVRQSEELGLYKQ